MMSKYDLGRRNVENIGQPLLKKRKRKKLLVCVAIVVPVTLVLLVLAGRIEGYWHGNIHMCLCEKTLDKFVEFSDGKVFFRERGKPKDPNVFQTYRRTGLFSYVMDYDQTLDGKTEKAHLEIFCFVSWIHMYEDYPEYEDEHDYSAWGTRIWNKSEWDTVMTNRPTGRTDHR